MRCIEAIDLLLDEYLNKETLNFLLKSTASTRTEVDIYTTVPDSVLAMYLPWISSVYVVDILWYTGTQKCLMHIDLDYINTIAYRFNHLKCP